MFVYFFFCLKHLRPEAYCLKIEILEVLRSSKNSQVSDKQNNRYAVLLRLRVWQTSLLNRSLQAELLNLLHNAFVGLTCCPASSCCSFLMSMRASAMLSRSLPWAELWHPSSDAKSIRTQHLVKTSRSFNTYKVLNTTYKDTPDKWLNSWYSDRLFFRNNSARKRKPSFPTKLSRTLEEIPPINMK